MINTPMKNSERFVVATMKSLTRLICRIDDSQLARVPERGPLIVAINHINFLEVPILYTHLQPRPLTGLMLAERWNDWWIRWFLELTGTIPLRRGEADVGAIRTAIKRLEAGYVVAIAPEGTRSGHGRLQKGHPGVALLALRSAAPVLPIVVYGSEQYRDNLRRIRRTNVNVAVGQPFRLDAGGRRVTGDVRQQMVDEIMYQISALLPQNYRGVYSDMSLATKSYLSFC